MSSNSSYTKAYIPLRRKIRGVGGWRWALPPTPEFLRWRYQHVGIFWCYLMLKFASPPTQNLNFALSPTPTPHASQWNIGGVGSSGVGHVYFMYISCIFHLVCASFSALATRKLANAKADSGGIFRLNIYFS